ncbi:MAG: ATP-dependent protease [Bacteroidetes bacterium]|nr:ATP-dependent protease [Bacteroidota bacterium]
MGRLHRMPLFPLGLVLYPGEQTPLHIFEPRYKEMVGRCMEQDEPFGIVLFEEDEMADIGCTARIVRIVEQYEDGRMDIVVEGEQRFRILDLYENESYLTVDGETIDEPEETPQRNLQQRLITQHMRLLELAGRTVRPSLYQDVDTLSYVIAPNAGLSSEQKQDVLEILTENQRVAYLVDHLEALIPRVRKMEDLRRRIQSNGHFKDFPPEVE